MSLKLRTQNYPSLQGCFSGMPLMPVPIQTITKTFEMANRYNRRTTRTESERVFCRWIYFHLRLKTFFALLRGGGDRPHRPPPSTDPPLSRCRRRGLASDGSDVQQALQFGGRVSDRGRRGAVRRHAPAVRPASRPP